MTFLATLGTIANRANSRLSEALDAQTAANREVTTALTEQREVMSSLRAVDAEHYESTRGVTLESRAEGRAFL